MVLNNKKHTIKLATLLTLALVSPLPTSAKDSTPPAPSFIETVTKAVGGFSAAVVATIYQEEGTPPPTTLQPSNAYTSESSEVRIGCPFELPSPTSSDDDVPSSPPYEGPFSSEIGCPFGSIEELRDIPDSPPPHPVGEAFAGILHTSFDGGDIPMPTLISTEGKAELVNITGTLFMHESSSSDSERESSSPPPVEAPEENEEIATTSSSPSHDRWERDIYLVLVP